MEEDFQKIEMENNLKTFNFHFQNSWTKSIKVCKKVLLGQDLFDEVTCLFDKLTVSVANCMASPKAFLRCPKLP